MSARRVLILGLDCASPALWLERFLGELPAFRRLLDGASFGPLRSVHPPITVPAWVSLATGVDPGELGLYGFHGRRERGAASALVDSSWLGAPTLWDLAGAAGKDSIVVGFPLGHPVRPLRGCAVSGMLTPPDASAWTWPHALGDELVARFGPYRFDVERDARRGATDAELFADACEMTRRRFRVLRELLRTRPWQLAFFHEIGLDRLQHALWCEPGEADSEAARLLLAYHRLLDDEIAATLDGVGDGVVVALVSDHGARALAGSFHLNEWLAEEGYLALRPLPADGPVAFDPALVDWENTRAFADGGYCGRVHLHGAPRDERGALASRDARALRDELRLKLEALRGPDGARLGNAVHLPEEVYARTHGVAPDLLVYAGDLDWRCAASVGGGALFAPGNDTGPDRANHDWDGVFALRDPERPGSGRSAGATLLDVAPTLLERLGEVAPGWMRGGRLP